MTGAITGALAIYCRLNHFLKQAETENNVSIKIEELESSQAFGFLKSNIQHLFLANDLEQLKQQIFELINGLSKNIEHWKSPQNYSSIFFYIRHWIFGKPLIIKTFQFFK